MIDEVKNALRKENWLTFAEIIDALRIIPRAILVALYSFYVWYIKWTTLWYFSLPDPQASETVFITGTITALGTMVTFFTNKYIETGRKWKE